MALAPLDAVAATERMEAAAPTAVESRLTAGRALAAAGRREEAVATLQRAAADAGRAGAIALPRLRRARAAPAGLPHLGRDPPGRPRGPPELTERERDIAGLVAAGQSQGGRGRALFLSEKTIEHHLSAHLREARRALADGARAILRLTAATRRLAGGGRAQRWGGGAVRRRSGGGTAGRRDGGTAGRRRRDGGARGRRDSRKRERRDGGGTAGRRDGGKQEQEVDSLPARRRPPRAALSSGPPG